MQKAWTHNPKNPIFRTLIALGLIFRSLKGFVFFVFLLSFVVFLNTLQMFSLVFWPFSQKIFRRINRFLADTWWRSCVFCLHTLNGVGLKLTGDPIPAQENALVLANHQGFADIYAIGLLASEKKRLGDLKWFAKKNIKYFPGLGWGMLFLDCLFLQRNWTADRTSILETFSKYRQEKISFWLISFVEGTRFTPAKWKRNWHQAKKKNLPLLRHLLLPKTRGFVATIEGLSEEMDAVYDLTIGFPKKLTSIWDILQGKAPPIHLHVRRYPVETLPQESKELVSWLLKRFSEKDALLEDYKKRGHFL
jgi:1-acyl-sn-glycerol-3-phosphate acyltransferase